MEILGPLLDSLDETRAALRGLFPGMSADEWDVFTLGYWAGALAVVINLDEEGVHAADVASRIEAELTRIEGRSASS